MPTILSKAYRSQSLLLSFFMAALLLSSVSTVQARGIEGCGDGPDNPRCLYYTGKKFFKEGDYTAAATSWEKLLSISHIDAGSLQLVAEAHNSMGYLKFFGFGVALDQQAALGHWHAAVGLGHIEAEYHLCHAYGDMREAVYNPDRARAHCAKSELVYKGMDERNRNDELILKQITQYVTSIER